MTTQVTSARELKESQLKTLLLDRVANGGGVNTDAFAAAMRLAMDYKGVDNLEWIANNAAYYYDGYRDALETKQKEGGINHGKALEAPWAHQEKG